MATNKFMRGTPLLIGDNTVPGLKLPEDVSVLIPKIIQECHDFNLDFYPIVVQKLTYDEISEVASYGGFPVRFPHWKWGMEYGELQKGYEHGKHRIYEMVINTNPCYIYCLDSNTLVDDVTVISHAIGHNDFFKSNVFFSPTSENMMNQLANHGTRIRRYIARWGKEKVTEFIDHVLRIETLIDPTKAWDIRKIKDPIVRDTRTYHQPNRLPVKDDHEYMDAYLNPKEWKERQNQIVREEEVAEEMDVFRDPTKDVMGFLRDNAPFKPWQADIISMLYAEAVYFAPQRMTHMLNEGWASFVDYNIIAKRGLVGLGQKTGDCGIIEYCKHKMGVLGGKYSLNPYKLGFCLFLDIEERWDKGQFGPEWEACEDIKQREDWDQKLGLGHQKVLDVRRYYSDMLALGEFFTPEFCNKYEFFDWKRYPNGEYRIEDRDPKRIKQKLLKMYTNGGLPNIRLTDPNHKGKGYLFLQHEFDGRMLYPSYTTATLQSLYVLWGRDVCLATQKADGEEIVFHCHGPDEDDIDVIPRKKYEDGYGPE